MSGHLILDILLLTLRDSVYHWIWCTDARNIGDGILPSSLSTLKLLS